MLKQIDYIIDTISKVAQAKKMAVNSLFGSGEEMTTIDIHLENIEEFEHLRF